MLRRRLTSPAAAAVAGVALLAVTFGVVLVERWQLGFSNVDDYLYARQSIVYVRGLEYSVNGIVDALRAYSFNSPLVPITAMPLAAINPSPNVLVLVQLPFLALVAGAVWSLLRRVGYSSGVAVLLGAGVAALPPVMTFASQFHFAVAAAGSSVLVVAGYLASERFTQRLPSLVCGVGFGLLAISRVVAPVYIAALVVPLILDIAWARRVAARQVVNAALGAAVAGLIAFPWWALNARAAIRYLTRVGYDPAAGFAAKSSRVDTLWARVDVTVAQTGLVLSALLVVFVVAAIVRTRGTAAARPVAILSGASVVGFLGLATSSTAGSGFAVPPVVLAACAVLVGARHFPRPTQLVVAGAGAVVAAATVLVGLGANPVGVGGFPLFRDPVPMRGELHSALGCQCAAPGVTALTREIARRVVGADVLMAREDALVNTNAMAFWEPEPARPTTFRSMDFGAALPSADELAEADFVLGGRTPSGYRSSLDQAALPTHLRAAGFRVVLRRSLSAHNDVVLWQRGAATRS